MIFRYPWFVWSFVLECVRLFRSDGGRILDNAQLPLTPLEPFSGFLTVLLYHSICNDGLGHGLNSTQQTDRYA
jgi:hypothetical protein